METTTSERKGTRPRALDATTVCEAFQITAQENPDRVALRTLDDSVSLTWSEYAGKVAKVASGLAGLGLRRGDTISLMLTNRPEFHVFDAAAMHLGATPFSVYNTYSAEQVDYLFSDAGNSIVVTEQAFLDTIMSAKERSSVEHVVVVDGGGDAGHPGTLSIEDVESRAEEGFDFESAWRSVGPEDVITLIYTSGTTGPPKGVQITHGNVISALRSFDQIIEFPSDGRVISWLPMAHIAERSCSHYIPMALGFTTTCCPDARQIAAYLPQVHPTWFFAVPRIWEKLKSALEAGIEGEEDEDRKQAMKWALDVGLRKVRAEQAGEEVPAELLEEYRKADAAVLSKLRERIGLDQVESVNVGAAPSPPEVIEFFHAIGVPLAELWGMSETCGAGCCNPPDRVKIGTVGPPAPDIEVRLAEDGEVLLRGGVVMAGYRNQPDKTRETIDEDGWLHTGDIGEFDDDGYLKIVDRKKELIISAAGKNMSPANIEAKVKAAGPLIGQAVAIGDNRPYNVALVTLDAEAAPGFARQHGISATSTESLVQEPAVIEAVQKEIDAANEDLARVEQIKKFKVLPSDWEPGGDELTPTMKLKRKPIAEKYKEEIEALYAS